MWSDPRKEMWGDGCCAVLWGRGQQFCIPFPRKIDSALHPRIGWPRKVAGIWSSIFPWLAHIVGKKALDYKICNYRMKPPPGMKGQLEKMAKSFKGSLLLRETALDKSLPDGAHWSPLVPHLWTEGTVMLSPQDYRGSLMRWCMWDSFSKADPWLMLAPSPYSCYLVFKAWINTVSVGREK